MTPAPRPGLLVDTNLLVLYIVGRVNPARIGQFKRTRKYAIDHFEFLCRLLDRWSCLYSVPHVFTEVSNLTDLQGHELACARVALRETITEFDEEMLPSNEAASGPLYGRLGLTDSAIAQVALKLDCEVLTDDLDLYLSLWDQKVVAHNFMHLYAGSLVR